jgi:hypothetical protein
MNEIKLRIEERGKKRERGGEVLHLENKSQ